ncbi:MAG: hypothetical protein DWI57_08345 [Chloroflexi bacterium]|nr:MAG: hypothetical protein DWI57_08345 [Chloroflexota bacterium]
MNFPMDPFFQFLFWLLNTPGVGGIAVGLLVTISISIYASSIFWIARGAKADEADGYAYPTSTLLDH